VSPPPRPASSAAPAEPLADGSLVAALRQALAAEADEARAPGMQAYMKSDMPYLGVQTPALRRLCRQVFADHPLPSFEAWQATVLELWRRAGFREERYAAIELTGDRRYRAHQSVEALPLYEEMVVSGAWWDLVDPVATRRIGGLLGSHPRRMRAELLAWSRSPDRWKRRASIICQVVRKQATDLELLYACIEPNLGDRDFFIRKAIGWALRSYAWIDPAEVLRYVAVNEAALSPLSRREALKNVRQ
jgi:3-methyladenine DNA glycosylase AlkD